MCIESNNGAIITLYRLAVRPPRQRFVEIKDGCLPRAASARRQLSYL